MNDKIPTTQTASRQQPPTRNWERFAIDSGGPRHSHLRISINRRGNILLNAAAMKRLGHPQAVALYFDRLTSAIGIEARPPDEADTFRISVHAGRGHGRVSALAFLRRYGAHSHTTLTASSLEIEDRMLILELSRLRQTSRSPSRSTREPPAGSA